MPTIVQDESACNEKVGVGGPPADRLSTGRERGRLRCIEESKDTVDADALYPPRTKTMMGISIEGPEPEPEPGVDLLHMSQSYLCEREASAGKTEMCFSNSGTGGYGHACEGSYLPCCKWAELHIQNVQMATGEERSSAIAHGPFPKHAERRGPDP